MSEEKAPLIGPALPPGYRTARGQQQHSECDRRRRSKAAFDETVAGPALPPGFQSSKSSDSSGDEDATIRCAEERRQSSPLELRKSADLTIEECNGKSRDSKQPAAPQDDDDEDDGFFGPALPPGFPKREQSPERPFIGPALPPGFSRSEKEREPAVPSSLSTSYAEEDSDEEALIGPMPSAAAAESNMVADIERRANRMKEKLASGNADDTQKQARESWMTELPPVLQNIGLGARTFKRRANGESSDRSIWTDTPADKEKKAQETSKAKDCPAKEPHRPSLSERDKRMAKEVASYNESRRSESLLDMHSKKLKRKAEVEKDRPQERRAFDREQDLQVHRFDEAQKKALIKKSKELNTRFSHGKSNMFL
ncbi:GPALPP motifs-containing protein 1 isoform X1 [Carcharodon carcharias]|uniref:GPALPP motifs-containing protein 1 isoform X1 n=1 Tax=Carcharodon carcharias TaxID=13397 RepID=UPI001B7EA358|nr:GPALPP motifs-containing protein 1 isoform X1 [Carcharodon carcharias]